MVKIRGWVNNCPAFHNKTHLVVILGSMNSCLQLVLPVVMCLTLLWCNNIEPAWQHKHFHSTEQFAQMRNKGQKVKGGWNLSSMWKLSTNSITVHLLITKIKPVIHSNHWGLLSKKVLLLHNTRPYTTRLTLENQQIGFRGAGTSKLQIYLCWNFICLGHWKPLRGYWFFPG